MLAQLFAWKVADLAVLRHGEPLRDGFWSWILFDVLVLRPAALVLPGCLAAAAATAPEGPVAPAAQEASAVSLQSEQQAAPGVAQLLGSGPARGGTSTERRLKAAGGGALEAEARHRPTGAAELLAAARGGRSSNVADSAANLGGSEDGAPAGQAKPPKNTGAGRSAVGGRGGPAGRQRATEQRACSNPGPFRTHHNPRAQSIPGEPLGEVPSPRRPGADPRFPRHADQSASPSSGTESSRCTSSSSSRGGGSSSRASSTCSSITTTTISSGSSRNIHGCGTSDVSCGRIDESSSSNGRFKGPEQPLPGSRASPSRLLAGAKVAVVRTRLAIAAVWRPLLDFLRTYTACEAVNAYLMHRHVDDILAAPYLVQVWLSVCFASALYFHLSYFFYSMEMVWAVGFALAVGVRTERWAPLFDSPERSTSPVDFWNKRWHQAFRWWWTRLVFLPVRAGLQACLDRLAPEREGPGHGHGHGECECAWPGAGTGTPHFGHEYGMYDGVAQGSWQLAGRAPGVGAGEVRRQRAAKWQADVPGREIRSKEQDPGAGTGAASHGFGEGERRQPSGSHNSYGGGGGGGHSRRRGGGLLRWASPWRWLLGLQPGEDGGCNGGSSSSGRGLQRPKKKNKKDKQRRQRRGGRSSSGGGAGHDRANGSRGVGAAGTRTRSWWGPAHDAGGHAAEARRPEAGDLSRGCRGSRSGGDFSLAAGLPHDAANCKARLAAAPGGGGRPRGRLSAWHRRTLLAAVPTVAVFLFSALFHETLLWINFGRPTGEQTAFFMLHAALVLLQRGVERSAPRLTYTVRATVPAPVRAAGFMGLMALSSVLFFRPWFRSSYHRELRVLLYGPAGWAVRVWVLGMPPAQARLLW